MKPTDLNCWLLCNNNRSVRVRLSDWTVWLDLSGYRNLLRQVCSLLWLHYSNKSIKSSRASNLRLIWSFWIDWNPIKFCFNWASNVKANVMCPQLQSMKISRNSFDVQWYPRWHTSPLLGEGRVHQVDDHALVYHCNLHWTGATTVELDITR